MKTTLDRALKSKRAIRIRTDMSAVGIVVQLENLGCSIRSHRRIDDPRKGSSLSALEVVGEKDGKNFTVVAAGAHF
jgi:hypothetical protein